MHKPILHAAGRLVVTLLLTIHLAAQDTPQRSREVHTTGAELSSAARALQQGDLNRAEQILRLVLQREPKNARAHHLLGLAYFQRGEVTLAEAELRTAASSTPVPASVSYDYGVVLISQNKFQEAAPQLERAVKLDPKDALALLFLGRAYHELNYSRKANQLFQRAVQIDPNVRDGYYHLGFSFKSLGDRADAEKYLRMELERDPDHALARYEIADIEYEKGNYDAALEAVTRSVRNPGIRAKSLYLRGKIFLRQQRIEDARQSFLKAVETSPDMADSYFQLSMIARGQGDTETAEKYLARYKEIKERQQNSAMASGVVKQ
ncbi:MAG TPA: tetratricopeptide repeat protein [Acidobacteriota bacterium]|jgi:tetratricopeptide (TPR) repeat protein